VNEGLNIAKEFSCVMKNIKAIIYDSAYKSRSSVRIFICNGMYQKLLVA